MREMPRQFELPFSGQATFFLRLSNASLGGLVLKRRALGKNPACYSFEKANRLQ